MLAQEPQRDPPQKLLCSVSEQGGNLGQRSGDAVAPWRERAPPIIRRLDGCQLGSGCALIPHPRRDGNRKKKGKASVGQWRLRVLPAGSSPYPLGGRAAAHRQPSTRTYACTVPCYSLPVCQLLHRYMLCTCRLRDQTQERSFEPSCRWQIVVLALGGLKGPLGVPHRRQPLIRGLLK